jgi:hypothetical protein
VRNYCENPADAYLIDERIKQLGLLERYLKELTKITHAKKIPSNGPRLTCVAAPRSRSSGKTPHTLDAASISNIA